MKGKTSALEGAEFLHSLLDSASVYSHWHEHHTGTRVGPGDKVQKRKKKRHIYNFKMSRRSPASTHLAGVLVQVTEVQRLHRCLAGRQWLWRVLAEWVALGVKKRTGA